MEYCKSIAERDIQRASRMISGEPLVELRADLMGLAAEELKGLIGLADSEIVTCHSAEAEHIYLAAIEAGAWAVDIELDTPEAVLLPLLKAARERGVRVILSHHFDHTPSPEHLKEMAERAFAHRADIAKIITTATTTAEAIVPLQLYLDLPAERLIAFAMGREGAFSRRLSLLLGAPYTYVAPTEGAATAEGQPTQAELQALSEEGFDLSGLTLPKEVTIPCSKSEAQRAIVAASLAKGTSIIYNAHACDDTLAALEVARSLGAKIEFSGTTLTIEGLGHEAISERLGQDITLLNVGESALLARLLLPILSTLLRQGEVRIEGQGTLLGRSLRESIELLEGYGAEVAHNDYHLPITIRRAATLPLTMEVASAGSSQIISGLMLSSALIDRDEMTHIVLHKAVSRPYIGLTSAVMEQFGGIVTVGGNEPLTIDIEPEPFEPSEVTLWSDWSSAGYFAAAYAIAQSGLSPRRRYTLHSRLGSWQGDEVVLMLLDISGANISVNERRGTIDFLPSDRLTAICYDATHTPDLIPTLAIVALFAEGESIIGGLERLKNKESNRLEALVENLVAIGAEVRIEGNELHIVGGKPLRPAPIVTHNDHRIAMAFAVAALFIPKEQRPTMDNTLCVAKSFPTFFQLLQG